MRGSCVCLLAIAALGCKQPSPSAPSQSTTPPAQKAAPPSEPEPDDSQPTIAQGVPDEPAALPTEAVPAEKTPEPATPEPATPESEEPPAPSGRPGTLSDLLNGGTRAGGFMGRECTDDNRPPVGQCQGDAAPPPLHKEIVRLLWKTGQAHSFVTSESEDSVRAVSRKSWVVEWTAETLIVDVGYRVKHQSYRDTRGQPIGMSALAPPVRPAAPGEQCVRVEFKKVGERKGRVDWMAGDIACLPGLGSVPDFKRRPVRLKIP